VNRPRIVAALTVAFCALTVASQASAQMFVESSTTRFPQPDPNEYTNQCTLGDIDGDTDLDIIWANGGNFTSAGTNQLARIYINDGTGVFTDQSVARGAVSGLFRGVELGDVDNDGDLDMVLAEDFNRQPNLLINNGSGFFTDESATRLPATTLGSSRAQFADIDNDGDLDLYFTNGGASRWGSGQNRIYVNNGAGVFTDETATRHPVAVLSEPQDAIFADIDGDYDLDVRTASTGSGVSRLYRNSGTGVYSNVAGVPADANCYSYDFGDIDGDNDLDLLGANASGSGNNSELMLRNDSAGTVFTNVSANISPNPAVDDNDSKFFDYDNDGDLDLIVARLGGTAERIYNNNGSGVFTEVTGLITAISDSTLDLKVGDVNGDGRLDIVTAQGESSSFRNRLYINTTGAVDTRAPRIVATEPIANNNNVSSPFVVRAAILDDMSSDRNFFDRGITLNYSIDAGPVQQVAARHSGGQVYRAVIPPVGCGGVVSYFFTARDFANNLGTGPTQMFTVTPTLMPGDLDADGDVDHVDGQILANVLIGSDTDPGHICRADLNGDTLRDGQDVISFVALIP